MKQHHSGPRYVICVKNDEYPASLEIRKIYKVMPDAVAAAHKYIRVIDKSEEDYLYPLDFFVPIRLPIAAEKAFAPATTWNEGFKPNK